MPCQMMTVCPDSSHSRAVPQRSDHSRYSIGSQWAPRLLDLHQDTWLAPEPMPAAEPETNLPPAAEPIPDPRPSEQQPAGPPPTVEPAAASAPSHGTSHTRLLADLRAQEPAIGRAAGTILAGMAVLGASGVPEEWLYRSFRSRRAVRAALAALCAQRLLQPTADGSRLTLDPLIGQFIRVDLATTTILPDEVTAAVTILSSAVVDEADVRQRRAALRMLAQQMAEILAQPQSSRLATDHRMLSLVMRVGWQAGLMGNAHTVLLLSGFAPVLQRRLGRQDPRTLAFRNVLAFAHRLADDPSGAVALYEPLLLTAQQQLGPQDALVIGIGRQLQAARQCVKRLAADIKALRLDDDAPGADAGRLRAPGLASRRRLAG